MKKLANKGDTIIEVMIALTVLMLIVGGGYSIATRSLNGVQIAKERSEANKIAEGQLEAIRWRVQNNPNLASLNTDGFINATGASGTNWNGLNNPSGWNTNQFCVVTSTGGTPPATTITATPVSPTQCSLGEGERYRVRITTGLTIIHPTNSSIGDRKQLTYQVVVEWDRSGGGNTEEIEVADRYVVE